MESLSQTPVNRVGYFALGDIYKPKDMATALNKFTNDGGLMCMMQPLECASLIRHLINHMRNNFPTYRKELVSIAGLQRDTHIVVINPQEYIDLADATIKPLTDSSFIWIQRYGLRPEFERRCLQPTSIEPLTTFFDRAHQVLGESFGVAVLAWGAFYSLTIYKWILDSLRHFNLPVLFGDPMSGKTLISTCAAWLTGCPNTSVASRCTLPYVTMMVTSSTLPFIWDDPSTADDVNQLAIDLGNAAVRGKATDEPRVPQTACLVTANFDMADMLKYFSRMLLMKVEPKKAEKQVGEARQLEQLAVQASAALPAVIKMLNELEVQHVHDETKRLRGKLNADIRILEGVSLQIHVVKQLLNLCGRYQYLVEVENYLDTILLPYYRRIMPAVQNNLADIEGHILEEPTGCDIVQTKNLNFTNGKLVKSGEALAATYDVVNIAKVRIRGGDVNKSTRLNGRTRKMVHIDRHLFSEAEWEMVCRQLPKQQRNPDPATLARAVPNPIHNVAPVPNPVNNVAPVPNPVNDVAPVPNPVNDVAPVPNPVNDVAPVQNPVNDVAPVQNPVNDVAPVPNSVNNVAPVPNPVNDVAPVPNPVNHVAPVPNPVNNVAPVPNPVNDVAPVPNHVNNVAPVPNPVNNVAPVPNPVNDVAPAVQNPDPAIDPLTPTPVEVCATCHKKGRWNQCWVECEQCHIWFHTKCADVKKNIYEKIRKKDIGWLCARCK